ncbi:MAG: alpha/beta fold hydrolase [Pseudomonadota bacterium]
MGDLANQVADLPSEAWAASVEREVRRRSDRFLTGLERYRHHPYRRDLDDPPAIWSEGDTRVLDYGASGDLPLFVVPSLINRGYVLDLSRRQSFLRWLATQGIRPLLVDWGAPGEVERQYLLTDYIAGRLERAFVAVSGGRPMPVLGYCMGGLLAAALAARLDRGVSGLVLMATPWDFHADGVDKARRLASCYELWRGWIEPTGVLPLDAIQALFMALDPLLAVKKFSRFAAMDQDGPDAEAFVALEDWLNDGVPLAAAVAKTCLQEWYGENSPAIGNWRIAGQVIDPAALDLPSLHLIPARDRIVPPASARALAQAMRNAHIIEPTLGHIGMVVSGAAKPQVWAVIADWLKELPAPPPPAPCD